MPELMTDWDDTLEEIGDKIQEGQTDAINVEMQAAEAELEHSEWRGDNMGDRKPETGLRLVTQNFERQLYATERAQTATAASMKAMDIDILVGFEPGLGNTENQTRMHNLVQEDDIGTELVTIKRSESTQGGGILVWMSNAWAQVPREVTELRTSDEEINGRAMAIEFNNGQQGDHNRMLLLAVHGINSATASPKARIQAAVIQGWIRDTRNAFSKKFPRASVIMATDINAAKYTEIDTDRTGPFTEGQLEPDAQIIKDIEDLRLHDVFRTAFPGLKAVTRRAKHTNRLLDRIFATSEAANHPNTRVAIYKGDVHGGGSDHLMVMADFPVDTAGVAAASTKMWEPLVVTRWVLDTDDLGKMKVGAEAEMNDRLKNTTPTSGEAQHVIDWIMDAAKGTMLKETTREYPKNISRRKHYSSSDHKVHANLTHMRHALLSSTWDEGQAAVRYVVKKMRPIHNTIHTPVAIASIKRACRSKGRAEPMLAAKIMEAEKYLRVASRKERLTHIIDSVKLRNARFDDPKKKKMKQVITSIMRRMAKQESITRVLTEGGMATTAQGVARGVTDFYTKWTRSKSALTDRWETREHMMRMDSSGIKDPRYKHLINTAYLPSYRKYSHLQDTEKIWDGCLQEITIHVLIEAIKSMKGNTAAGPSGLNYEILKAIDKEHLNPLVHIMNEINRTGKVPTEINRTLLKPLPKTDKGLSDLSLTRPIALMETLLKIYERIIFGRIMNVITKHKMLREEQYGALPRRSAGSPIRVLTEIIEDAIQSGRELHLFSADIKRAFDSLEPWSQAMSWRALGMPEEMIDLLVDMDIEGTTEVAIGQGRTTATELGDAGRYYSERGVRQGSIGGPIKWVVYMHFWLEFIHTEMEGKGYKMSADLDTEVIGQMFVDDSTWAADTVEHMTEMIGNCETFVDFHSLEFNKKKSEYTVINQPHDQWNYTLPTWSNGDNLHEVMRKHTKPKEWKQLLKDSAELELTQRWDALSMEGCDQQNQAPLEQPKEESYTSINRLLTEWTKIRKEDYHNQGQGDTHHTHAKRTEIIQLVNKIKESAYPGASKSEVETTTREWLESWELNTRYIIKNTHDPTHAVRYLGVFFSLDLEHTSATNAGWMTQRKILTAKFEDSNRRISRSCPTRHQTVYCINAVINAQLKYPLQVANVPDSVLDKWDAAHCRLVCKAGKLPPMSPELMYRPKDKGGLGLSSLKTLTKTKLAADQMMYLNQENTIVGRVTRAAYKRHKLRPDTKVTLQHRIEHIVTAMTLKITECTTTTNYVVMQRVTKHYNSSHQQADIDIRHASAAARNPSGWRAYGDGATWEDLAKAGWGTHIESNDKSHGIRRDKGRLSGDQKNEAAEAQAILRILLAVHPQDNIQIYCDNAECVRKWGLAEGMENDDSMLNWENRATWKRIRHMIGHRRSDDSTTTMQWIHSHVIGNEERRTAPSVKMRCACRVDPQHDECALPGEGTYWMHEGNEEADTQAKEGANLAPVHDLDAIANGDARFVIHCGQNVAQGHYGKWIEQWRRKYASTPVAPSTDPIGVQKWDQATEMADDKLTSAAVKMIDTPGFPSWRMWARMVIGILPTLGRMAHLARTNSEYAEVYTQHIGEDGACPMPGCQAQKESTRHAICECNHAQQRWQRTSHAIDKLWDSESENWSKVDWVTKPENYPGWNPHWSTWGLVPKQAMSRTTGEYRKTFALMKKTIAMIVKTSQEIWTARSDNHALWEDARPDLVARKKLANTRSWRNTRKVHAAPEQPTEEEILREAIKLRSKERRDEITEEEQERYDTKTRPTLLGILPQAECVQAHVRHATDARMIPIDKALNEPLKKLRMAKGTRRLTEQDMGPVVMQDTVPMTCEIPIQFFWIPKEGTKVKVLWTTPDGEHKLGNLRGTWFEGTVKELAWSDDSSIPQAKVIYKCGTIEWHGLHLTGTVMKPAVAHKDQKGKIPNIAKLPKRALQWIGEGSRLRITKRGPRGGTEWKDAVVVGREPRGIILKYTSPMAAGEEATVLRNDLHTAGCYVRSFKRWCVTPLTTCPRGGSNMECGCKHCEDVIWPGRCAATHMTEADSKTVLDATPSKRLQIWTRLTSAQNGHNTGGGLTLGRNAMPTRPSKRRNTETAGTGHSSDQGESTQADQVGSEPGNNRAEQGSEGLGMGGEPLRQARNAQNPRAKRNEPEMDHRRPENPNAGKRGSSVVAGKRNRHQSESREDRGNANAAPVDHEARNTGKRRQTAEAQAREAQPATHGDQENTDRPRRANSRVRGPGAPRSNGEPHPGHQPTETQQPRSLEPVEARDHRPNDPEGMVPTTRPDAGAEQSNRPNRNMAGNGRGRGMGVGGPSDPRDTEGREGRRSGHQGPHQDGQPPRSDHSGDQARPLGSTGDRPCHSHQQEGGSPSQIVGTDMAVVRVPTIHIGERPQPVHGDGTWEMGSNREKQGQRRAGKAGSRGTAPRNCDRGDLQPTRRARSPSADPVRLGEPQKVRGMEPSGDAASDAEEQGLAPRGSRPVRLREGSHEADEHTHEPTAKRVDTEGTDTHGEVQSGGMRRHSTRHSATHTTDSHHQTRDQDNQGKQDWQQAGVHKGRSGQRSGGGASPRDRSRGPLEKVSPAHRATATSTHPCPTRPTSTKRTKLTAARGAAAPGDTQPARTASTAATDAPPQHAKPRYSEERRPTAARGAAASNATAQPARTASSTREPSAARGAAAEGGPEKRTSRAGTRLREEGQRLTAARGAAAHRALDQTTEEPPKSPRDTNRGRTITGDPMGSAPTTKTQRTTTEEQDRYVSKRRRTKEPGVT
jgi:hypothetical protein